ncbi:MAG TPA: hypothetical protein PKK60_02250 [archaeon]|nr:hypothetical protein [archaeon]
MKQKENSTKKETKSQDSEKDIKVKEKVDLKKTEHKKHVSKKEFLQKNKLLLFGVIFILVVFILFFFFMNTYKYSFVLGGVKFVSNEYTPTEFFNDFKTKQTVYVSPVMIDTKADPIVVNVLNLWQIVLIGNSINAIQLIRATNENGNILYCYTNDGNVLMNKQITLNECNEIINDSKNTIILIETGNESKAVLSKNKLVVYSQVNSINATNFSIMKQIFPNTEELIRIVNESVYGL